MYKQVNAYLASGSLSLMPSSRALSRAGITLSTLSLPDWLSEVRWLWYWPLIGYQRSGDYGTGLWLVIRGQVTMVLASDWLSEVRWLWYWPLIGYQGRYNLIYTLTTWLVIRGQVTRLLWYWPLIGYQRSGDYGTGLWLVIRGQVTMVLTSDWLSEVRWLWFWPLIGYQRSGDYGTDLWLVIRGQVTMVLASDWSSEVRWLWYWPSDWLSGLV